MADEETKRGDERTTSGGERTEVGQLISLLTRQGIISMGDADTINAILPPNATAIDAAGLIAGELGISPRTIADATEGSSIRMHSFQIDERKRNIAEQLILHQDVPETALLWSYDRIAEWGGSLSGAIVDAFTPPPEEERRDRERVRDKLRDEIRGLRDMGYITEDRATKMLSVTDNYDQGTYRDLFNELNSIYDDIPMADWTQDRIINRASVLQELRRIGDLTDTPDTELDGQQLGPYTAVPTPMELAEIQQTGGYGEYRRAQGGVGLADQEIADKLAQMQRPFLAYESVFGYSIQDIYDPVTGKAYSPQQYEIILRNDPRDEAEAVLIREYASDRQITPYLREVIDKPFFSGDRTTPQIPIEDLAVKTAIPTQPWQVPAVQYRRGDGLADWRSLSPRAQRMRWKYMRDQGLVTEEQYQLANRDSSLRGNMLAVGIWERATALAGVTNTDPINSLNWMGQELRLARAQTTGGGSGRMAPTYSVPASLREIPDAKTLAAETKGVFRQRMGRDLEDWELNLLGDELKDAYETQRTQRIAAHKAAWDDAVSGGTVDVEAFEVPDPSSVLLEDIEDLYANEIDRYERVEDQANNRRVLMDSITLGRRMI